MNNYIYQCCKTESANSKNTQPHQRFTIISTRYFTFGISGCSDNQTKAPIIQNNGLVGLVLIQNKYSPKEFPALLNRLMKSHSKV